MSTCLTNFDRYCLSARRSLPTDGLPVSLPSNIQIARRPKATPESAILINGGINGLNHIDNPSLGVKRKRSLGDTTGVDSQMIKKSKVQSLNGPSNDESAVIIDDSGSDGAIVIDDD